MSNILCISCEMVSQMIARKPHQWKVNIASGNDLDLSLCHKALPEPMLTKFYIAIWYDQEAML